MKKYIKSLIYLMVLLLTIYLCFRNYQLKRQLENFPQQVIGKTDTVYLNKEFSFLQAYPHHLLPSKIIFYQEKDSATVKPSTVENDSLVQMVLKRSQLSLSFLNQNDSSYYTKLFPIDLRKYQYNWSNGKLTFKENSGLQIKPYVYGKFRMFNQMLDLGLGLSFKTNRFNYKLGFNTFYYPNIKSGIGKDIELSITYNF